MAAMSPRGRAPKKSAKAGPKKPGRTPASKTKVRWSATDRQKRDAAVAKRDEIRGTRSAGRDDRSYDRDERRSFSRDDRFGGRDERRSFNRDDRFGGRDERRSFHRDDRFGERDERRSFNRDDRDGRGSFNRDDRGERRSFGRDERRSFNRDDRFGGRDERRSFQRDERDGRGSFQRDERRSFNRDDRFGGRDDRRSFNRDERDDRGSRGSFNREDRFARDERRSFSRDDRGDRRSFDREDRFGGRDERRTSNRDERGASHEGRGAWGRERPTFKHPARDERPFGDRREGRGAWGRNDRSDRFDRGERRPRRDDRSFDRDDREPQDTMSWEQASDVVTGSETTGFADLGLPAKLVSALSGQGITEPFAIQAVTIPDALTGRDLLGRAETGSGKTLGFGLPVLARLDASQRLREPRALVLVPTRELAVQVADALGPLAANLGLRVALVAGGMSYNPQRKAFERGTDLVVATPGRLIDLMEQEVVDLSKIEVAVLDEADHMADLGFLPDVRRILDATPADGQRLLFSATLDNAVATIVREYLHDPVTHEVDSGQASVATMTHRVLQVAGQDKGAVAAQIANRPGRTLVFVRTQRAADRVAATMREHGIMAAALHGGQTQGMRVRVLNAFKSETVPVLIATDVAARGIHVDDVSLVLQLDPAANAKDYLHRAGRTARAGAEGQVVTLAGPNQRKSVARLLKDAGVDVVPRRVQSGGEVLEELTGGAVPSAAAISDEELSTLLAPPRPARRPRTPWNGGRARRRRFER